MDLEVLNIAANTDNNRNIENRTHVSKLKNSICGDEMQIELILKNEKILDFGYQGKSCVYCQASASLLSKISINNQKEKINDLCDKAELYEKDYVVEVTPKGTWYSAPYNGEDTSGVVILFFNPTDYTDGDKIVNL